jgi:hypothetical protein
VLHTRYPDMMAVDIDQRAIQLLTESLPGLNLVHSDVLQIDYTQVINSALHFDYCMQLCKNNVIARHSLCTTFAATVGAVHCDGIPIHTSADIVQCRDTHASSRAL